MYSLAYYFFFQRECLVREEIIWGEQQVEDDSQWYIQETRGKETRVGEKGAPSPRQFNINPLQLSGTEQFDMYWPIMCK